MQITQVAFTQNNTALCKVVKGDSVAIIEIELTEKLGLQPFSISNLSAEQFDELENIFDATEDNSVSAFISNNRDSFDALHSN